MPRLKDRNKQTLEALYKKAVERVIVYAQEQGGDVLIVNGKRFSVRKIVQGMREEWEDRQCQD